MSNFQQVQGHSNLVRDKRTGAILNVNRLDIQRAKKIKAAKQQEADTVQALTEQVQSLQSDMNDIKRLLMSLVEDKK